MSKFLPLILLLSSSLVVADMNDEINHLLSFVEKTQCTYHRNGSAHNGKEARQHIQKKYDYYRDEIKTSEDFIAYSATKSMISGKNYTIRCDDENEQFSSEWLNNELKFYRTQLLEKQ